MQTHQFHHTASGAGMQEQLCWVHMFCEEDISQEQNHTTATT